MEKLTPNHIIELSQHNPIIHHCFMYWRNGELSWDEMLLHIAYNLAMHNKQLEEQIKTMADKLPADKLNLFDT